MAGLIEQLLEVDDAALDERWLRLERWVRDRFGRDVSIEAVLFLIGVQSRGIGFQPELQKEVKQDLIMEGTCCAFETLGLYERIGLDADGMWIWERSVDDIPKLDVEKQEKLLRLGIVRYFDDVLDVDSDGKPSPFRTDRTSS